MINARDLGTLKIAMLHQLDATLRRNYHQSLLEVLNELRMRSIVPQPDPTPERVFSVILQTHMLPHTQGSESAVLRGALERIVRGKYGICIRCGKEIPVEILLREPSQPFCSLCQTGVNC